MQCPLDETVLAFVAGKLPAERRPEIEAHVANCDACRELFHALGPDERPVSADERVEGDRVSRYIVGRRLGAGGMGVVFEAFDPLLRRHIALKLVRAEQTFAERADEMRARMLREATAQARLSHPNVVAVHDVGRAGDSLFLAMELIDGRPLSTWLRARQRPWQEILEVFIQAGRGLAAAHEAGLVHRDFKPGNVLVGNDGRVCVADFGLVRFTGALADELAQPPDSPADEITRPGQIMGSPAYMAPEQIDGLPVDQRADVFSFCVSLYECLFGRRPFSGATVYALREAMRRPPADVQPGDVPPWLVEVIRQGLSEDPQRRWPTMRALITDLRRETEFRGLRSAAELIQQIEAEHASSPIEESDPLVQTTIAVVRELGAHGMLQHDEAAAAAVASVLGAPVTAMEASPAEISLVESTRNHEVWLAPRSGRMELRWRPGAVWRVAEGHVPTGFAPHVLRRLDEAARGPAAKVVFFNDSRNRPTYDPRFREAITAWLHEHRSQIEAVHLIGISPLLAAAVALTNVALGGVARVHSDRSTFEAALRASGF